MARWRLRTAHYLNVIERYGERIEWEYSETSRDTGRRARKLFPVPLMLDTNNAADFNYPGEIIVCTPGKGLRDDIEFLGEPTPDMEALDEEAEAISASLRNKWEHPIDSLATAGQMSPQETAFMANMMKAFAQTNSQSVLPEGSIAVSKDELAKIVAEQVAAALALAAKPAEARRA